MASLALLGEVVNEDKDAAVKLRLFEGQLSMITGHLLAACVNETEAVQRRAQVQAHLKELRSLVGKGKEQEHLPTVLYRACQDILATKR